MSICNHGRYEDIQNPKSDHKDTASIFGHCGPTKFSFTHEGCEPSHDKQSDAESSANGVSRYTCR